MKKIIAGNWKFNKELRNLKKAVNFIEELEERIKGFNNVEVKVFPHNSVLAQLINKVKKIKLGSQDIHWEEDGSFTGAHFSAQDLRAIGAKETLIGHSETRFYFGVDDKKVALKLKAVFKNGIIPTICIGEDIEEKERGEIEMVLRRQIVKGILPAFAKVSAGKPAFTSSEFVVAYEPVYAIAGFAKLKGLEPKPPKIEDIKYAFETIRKIFSENGYSEINPSASLRIDGERNRTIKILYGGSSNPENARELLSQPFINGLLLGTASWNLDSFFEMIKIAGEICVRRRED